MNAYTKGRNNNQQQVARVMPQPEGMNLPVEQWTLLTDVIWPGAKTPGAIKLAFDYCRARNLDPFKRPVHIVPMYNSRLKAQVETVWPGIADLETTAARTGEWAGMDEPKWGPMIEREFVITENGQDEFGQAQSREKAIKVRFPEWCIVPVYRMVKGHRQSFSEPVFWEETYATLNRWSEAPNEMWRRRPRGQLHKCAKAASIRAAFPEETGHDYTSEEMEGKTIDGGGVIIPGTATFQEDEQQSRTQALIASEQRVGGLEEQMAKVAELDKEKVPVGNDAPSEAAELKPESAHEPPAYLDEAPPPSDFPGDPEPPPDPDPPQEQPKKSRSFSEWLNETDREFSAAKTIAAIGEIERREDIQKVRGLLNPKQAEVYKSMIERHMERIAP